MPDSRNIEIVTPAPRYSRKGNRISAERWARLLRELGHDVRVTTEYSGRRNDLTIALHARRLADAVCRASEAGPVVLVLTGTDVYGDIHSDRAAQESLDRADALVVLQDLAVNQLPERHRSKARTIFQSVDAPLKLPPKSKRHLNLCVVGHMRAVKDPMRAARAARGLPAESRIRVVHAGGIIDESYLGEVEREAAANPRYQYRGELPRARVLDLVARSHALVLTSQVEGGANVIGEACVCGTPVLASDIDGSRGLLGDDYPGCFPVGDTAALTALMQRFEKDDGFREGLIARCHKLAGRFRPDVERSALRKLVNEVV